MMSGNFLLPIKKEYRTPVARILVRQAHAHIKCEAHQFVCGGIARDLFALVERSLVWQINWLQLAIAKLRRCHGAKRKVGAKTHKKHSEMSLRIYLNCRLRCREVNKNCQTDC